MERIRLRIVAIGLVLLLVIMLGGCGGKNRLPDYRDVAFRARGTWDSGGVSIEALVTFDRYGTERIELLAPEELSSLVLLSEGEERKVLCGEVELDGRAMSALFETVGVILPVGERRVVCPTEWEGESVMYAEIAGDPVVELYLEPESGVPLGIVRGDLTVRIHSFEVLSEEEGAS